MACRRSSLAVGDNTSHIKIPHLLNFPRICIFNSFHLHLTPHEPYSGKHAGGQIHSHALDTPLCLPAAPPQITTSTLSEALFLVFNSCLPYCRSLLCPWVTVKTRGRSSLCSAQCRTQEDRRSPRVCAKPQQRLAMGGMWSRIQDATNTLALKVDVRYAAKHGPSPARARAPLGRCAARAGPERICGPGLGGKPPEDYAADAADEAERQGADNMVFDDYRGKGAWTTVASCTNWESASTLDTRTVRACARRMDLCATSLSAQNCTPSAPKWSTMAAVPSAKR
ncbi:hypothetical protein WMY93_002966 [Mugilogobius chulae]|uniref:Uncharacterized protein n=1 Tax=Mugilogobius chulae TaxID=88201 RepID=A0AAW0PW46_9GOBI